MGTAMASGFLGLTLLGIPSGTVAARLGARRTMLVSDAVSAPLVALIPALHWAGLLSFPVVLGVAFAVGAFFPAYSASQRLVLVELVGEDEARLTGAGALLGSVNETASFAGPAIGGFLVALAGPAAVLLIDAGSYAVAFALVAGFVPPVRHPTPTEASGRGAVAGLRYLRRDPRLASTVVGLAVYELGWTAMIATLPVTARRRYHAGAGLAGWLLASYGAGSVLGGLVSSRARSVGDRIALVAIAGAAVATWPLLAPLPAWGAALAVAANGVCSGLFFPRFFAALTLRTPPPLRANVSTSVTTAISATGPLGFVAAGFLLDRSTSSLPGFAVAAAGATLGAATVSYSRHSQSRPLDQAKPV
jgi:MFS family permease